nr:MAG TPA: hypothetical protein [Caudoviricetes sp.]
MNVKIKGRIFSLYLRNRVLNFVRLCFPEISTFVNDVMSLQKHLTIR